MKAPPRGYHLHLDFMRSSASHRNDRPTDPTDASPTLFGHSFRSPSLVHDQGRMALRRFRPVVVPHSLPLLPLLACTLPLPRRAFLTACGVFHFLLLSRQGMTHYNLTASTILPSFAVQEKKAARRKVIEAAEHTRKANYQRFLRRMAYVQKTLREKHRRLHANGDLATMV